MSLIVFCVTWMVIVYGVTGCLLVAWLGALIVDQGDLRGALPICVGVLGALTLTWAGTRMRWE